MCAAHSAVAAAPRQRPKDRKQQIARASAEAFSAQGYHGVSMEDIASRVGISAAALYRHSPSKYDLFRDAVLSLGQLLVDATAFADDAPLDDPQATLAGVIEALIDVSLRHRTAGGLYRWEGRYLLGEDQLALGEQIKIVNRRFHRPLAALRPKLTSRQRWLLSSAVLGVIGSITDHRMPLGAIEVRSVVTEMATDVLATELPLQRGRADVTPPHVVTAAAGTYEVVLYESMRLFRQCGYRATNMEDIAAASGILASGLYQYFPGKADILAASYRRAADQLSSDLSAIASRPLEPERILSMLIDTFVERCFARHDFASVYYTERQNVPVADSAVVDSVHRSSVEAWARLVVAARPGTTVARARYNVHAAFAFIVDPGRLLYDDNAKHARTTVRRLMEVALLGRPARFR